MLPPRVPSEGDEAEPPVVGEDEDELEGEEGDEAGEEGEGGG